MTQLISSIIKRKKLFLTAGILILAAVMAVLFVTGNDSRRFRKFTEDLFISEVSSNTLNMHYTLASPELYGITYEPHLSVYTPGSQEKSVAKLQEMLHFLAGISPGKLSQTDAYTYHLLVPYLENALARNKLAFYDEPFSPSSGAQTSLPILLADYTFRSTKDVDDYLAILDEIDDYLQGLILFEQEKALEGLFMPDYSVDKVIEQCDRIMDQEALASGSHFLHVTFRERLDALEAEGLLSPEQKEQYLALNDRLLTTVVAPAYEKAGDSLLLLKGSGNNQDGLCHYPQGQEYYTSILQSTTGSYRDMNETKQLLYDSFDQNYNALIKLASSYTQTVDTPLRELPMPEFSSPQEMLGHLQEQMQKDFPAFPLEDGTPYPSYNIKNISELMAAYSSPAYYLTPPIDDVSHNIIYINPNTSTDAITQYTTLAHEGYPGHLYQTVYSQLYMRQTEDNPMRYILHYGGYVEGWALYVEMSSYDYLIEYMQETSPESAYLLEYCRLNRAIQLSLYSLLDIAIHYDGAGEEQIRNILATIGITDPSIARSIYEYIVEEPTVYLKYYLGYLEIMELKEKAETIQGNAYSDYEFHKFFLEAGPSDFTNLEKRLMSRNQTQSIS